MRVLAALQQHAFADVCGVASQHAHSMAWCHLACEVRGVTLPVKCALALQSRHSNGGNRGTQLRASLVVLRAAAITYLLGCSPSVGPRVVTLWPATVWRSCYSLNGRVIWRYTPPLSV